VAFTPVSTLLYLHVKRKKRGTCTQTAFCKRLWCKKAHISLPLERRLGAEKSSVSCDVYVWDVLIRGILLKLLFACMHRTGIGEIS
jgi:hypothetical protein